MIILAVNIAIIKNKSDTIPHNITEPCGTNLCVFLSSKTGEVVLLSNSNNNINPCKSRIIVIIPETETGRLIRINTSVTDCIRRDNVTILRLSKADTILNILDLNGAKPVYSIKASMNRERSHELVEYYYLFIFPDPLKITNTTTYIAKINITFLLKPKDYEKRDNVSIRFCVAVYSHDERTIAYCNNKNIGLKNKSIFKITYVLPVPRTLFSREIGIDKVLAKISYEDKKGNMDSNANISITIFKVIRGKTLFYTDKIATMTELLVVPNNIFLEITNMDDLVRLDEMIVCCPR